MRSSIGVARRRYRNDIIVSVANLHVRDVPPECVDVLRQAARSHGRSLNAELVEAIAEHAQRERARATIVADIARIRREHRRLDPGGYPAGLEPETIVREARDAR